MSSVVKVVLVLLAIWIPLGIIGFIVKGLFRLFVHRPRRRSASPWPARPDGAARPAPGILGRR